MKNIIRIELIEKYLTEKGIDKIEFCKQAKIDAKSLRMIYRDDYSIGIEVVFKISKLLGIRLCELFEKNTN